MTRCDCDFESVQKTEESRKTDLFILFIFIVRNFGSKGRTAQNMIEGHSSLSDFESVQKTEESRKTDLFILFFFIVRNFGSKGRAENNSD